MGRAVCSMLHGSCAEYENAAPGHLERFSRRTCRVVFSQFRGGVHHDAPLVRERRWWQRERQRLVMRIEEHQEAHVLNSPALFIEVAKPIAVQEERERFDEAGLPVLL